MTTLAATFARAASLRGAVSRRSGEGPACRLFRLLLLAAAGCWLALGGWSGPAWAQGQLPPLEDPFAEEEPAAAEPADDPAPPAAEPGLAAEPEKEPSAEAPPPADPAADADANPPLLEVPPRPAGPAPAPAADAAQREFVGCYFRITAPLTEEVEARVRRVVGEFLTSSKNAGQWPVFIFEIEPGRMEFGEAFELARFLSGPNLNGATTVAFVPQTVTGHGVLLALACDELAMAAQAELGEAGQSEPVGGIGPPIRQAYVEIAGRRGSFPADLAVGLLDPEVEVLLATTEQGQEVVLAERLEQLAQEHTVAGTKVLAPRGQALRLSGLELRELGCVSLLAENLEQVAQAWGLSREGLLADRSPTGQWQAVQVNLKGPLSGAEVERVKRTIQDAIVNGQADFLCLWIDSPGGSPIDASGLANYLVNLPADEVRTVAFIEREARGDAALVALACDQIVMLPNGTLGGEGAAADADQLKVLAQSCAEIAQRKFRPAILSASLISPQAIVYRYVRQADGRVDYFSEEELAARDDAVQWAREAAVTAEGQTLELRGARAAELGLARQTVADFAEFKAIYGLQDDPALAAPGWVDVLVDVLRSRWVTLGLLIVGAIALAIEVQTPGVGAGALIAGLCFMIFFWASFLGGTANWLEVLLFVAGVICLLFELFVLPGFGVFGIVGALLVVGSLILASQTFIVPRNAYQMGQLQNMLLILVLAGAGIIGGLVALRKYLPRTKSMSGMVLSSPSAAENQARRQREALASFDHLLGERGTTITPLVPGGRARFGDQLVDVTTEGEFVAVGQPVQVAQVQGYRVIVRAVAAE